MSGYRQGLGNPFDQPVNSFEPYDVGGTPDGEVEPYPAPNPYPFPSEGGDEGPYKRPPGETYTPLPMTGLPAGVYAVAGATNRGGDAITYGPPVTGQLGPGTATAAGEPNAMLGPPAQATADAQTFSANSAAAAPQQQNNNGLLLLVVAGLLFWWMSE